LILPSELLRVRRSKGKIISLYAGDDKISLAKTLISIFEESVGKKYGDLSESLDRCEDLGYNYRLVRGLSTILIGRCSFQTRAVVSPIDARRAVFEEVGGEVLATAKERSRILAKVSSRMGLRPEDLEASLYADLSDEQILSEFRSPEPLELLREYNFSATLAIISRAKKIELRCKGNLEEPSKTLGKGVIDSEKGAFTLSLDLRPVKRAGQQQAELKRLIAGLILQEDWSISAELLSGKKSYLFELSKRKVGSLVAPKSLRKIQEDWSISAELLSGKKSYLFELSKRKVGSLVAPKSLRKILAKEGSGTSTKERPLGDVVLVEELAASLGVTESEARKNLTMKGTYVDLGDVFISAGKLREIEAILGKGGEMTLSDVMPRLRKLGCRRPLQVLEALGYSVDWAENRDESRVHKLSGFKSVQV